MWLYPGNTPGYQLTALDVKNEKKEKQIG